MKAATGVSLRDDIIRVAIELGSQLGEDGLTMRAIAGRMGISATGLYQYFDSKASILREIRSHGVRMLLADLRAAATNEDRAQRLRDMAHAYLGFARRNPWLYQVVFLGVELDWTTMSDEERSERLLPLRIARVMFSEGVARVEFRADLDPDQAVLVTWSALHGLASLTASGRISATHPALPVPSIESFTELFVTVLVGAYLP